MDPRTILTLHEVLAGFGIALLSTIPTFGSTIELLLLSGPIA
ncbi:MAG TPA: hypothetical protein VFQ89_03315 [Candidatus Binatia bacterium]|nr:hypothetical protein [Candidatus Binatia bacterium]